MLIQRVKHHNAGSKKGNQPDEPSLLLALNFGQHPIRGVENKVDKFRFGNGFLPSVCRSIWYFAHDASLKFTLGIKLLAVNSNLC